MNALFEDKERNYNGTKFYAELDYEYLDRSSRSEAKKVRDLLNQLFSLLPEDEQKDIHSRITGRDTSNYKSATFELLLHGIFITNGCEVTIHPKLNNGSTSRPDFLIKTPYGNEFYLEAVLASEFDDNYKAAEKRKDVVLDTINKMESPCFFLGITAEGNPDTPPKGKPLKRHLQAWLKSLDPDTVIKEIEEKGHEALPTTMWNHDGWEIEFEAIPKKPESRGKDGNIIGVLSGGVRWVNSWRPMRDAITSKGNHYGELDKPFLIAVNTDLFRLDKIDEMQALFGEEQYIFKVGDQNPQPEMQRAPNGAWHGKQGVQYTRVSGVWFFDNLNPWNIVSRKHTIYFNPWAQAVLPDYIKVFPYAQSEDNKMVWNEGKNLGDALGLEAEWPE